jgi:hypothetical protein
LLCFWSVGELREIINSLCERVPQFGQGGHHGYI